MCYFVFYAEIRCDPLASVPFGHYTNQSCVKQKSRYEAICQLVCDVGFTLHGHPVQTCTESDWSPEVTGHCERINCGQPQNLTNAAVQFNGTTFEDTAHYTCDIGFQYLSEASFVETKCNGTGNWTSANETCQ
ncbi:hypothetical protein LSAT2_017944, partial [Lamellibrachia satsuma]